MTLATASRIERARNDWTQAEAAKAWGVTKNAVSMLESGAADEVAAAIGVGLVEMDGAGVTEANVGNA